MWAAKNVNVFTTPLKNIFCSVLGGVYWEEVLALSIIGSFIRKLWA